MPKNGTCCSCGYDSDEETPCAKREDGSHCVYWWDGPGDYEIKEEAVPAKAGEAS
jgi:hypothetical protein